MVLAYHLIMTAYGFWLPNDPRGSWSNFVGAWDLLRFGRATKVTTRRSLARRPCDPARRDAAKAALQYPPVVFDGRQAQAVGTGFSHYAAGAGLTLHALAVMPDHVHLVAARHRLRIEQIAVQLKGAATRQLLARGLHPLAAFAGDGQRPPTPWARGQWAVYLDDPADIVRAIGYVHDNPVRAGLPRQTWRAVTAYGGA